MIGFKLAINLVGVLLTSGLSYVAIASLLLENDLDDKFFNNPNLSLSNKSHLEDYDNPNSSGLDSVNGTTKNYLLKNTFSFYWGDEKYDNSDKQILSNGFLLNILSDKDFYGTNTKNAINWNIPSNKIHLLVGTSLSFATKLFDKIDDLKTEVNDAKTSVNLKNKTNSANNKFKISQPHLFKKEEKDRVKPINVVQKKDNSLSFDDSYYIEVDNSDIELIYTATDLSINSDAMNLNSWFPLVSVDDILTNVKKPVWKDTIDSSKNKFAVDFAVLKISIPIYKFKNTYLNYLQLLTNEIFSLNNAFTPGIYGLSNKKIKNIAMSGYSKLSFEEQNLLHLKNLVFSLKIKDDKLIEIKNKKASDINCANDFKTYFELSFYEGIENINKELMKKYDYECFEFQAIDETGDLHVTYKLKYNNQTIDKKNIAVFSGFKKTGDNVSTINKLKINFSNRDKDAHKKYNNLIQEPLPLVDLNEYYLTDNYLAYDNFYKMYANRSKNKEQPLDLDQTSDVFKIKGTTYVNVSHRIKLPFKKLDNFKGSLALSYDWNSNKEDYVLGIYEGNKKSINAFNKELFVGNIAMLVSPLYYDLIGKNNNFSKPSLMDSLSKKKLEQKVLWKQIFITH